MIFAVSTRVFFAMESLGVYLAMVDVMTLSEAEILQIIRMLEDSSFGELRLKTGDLKLVVRKKGYLCLDNAHLFTELKI